MSSFPLPEWIQQLMQQTWDPKNYPSQEIGKKEYSRGVIPAGARPFFLAIAPLAQKLRELQNEYLESSDMKRLEEISQESRFIKAKIDCLEALFQVEIDPLLRGHPDLFLSHFEVRKGWILAVVPDKNAGKILASAFEQAQQEEYGL